MNEQELKDTIVRQALEITELKRELHHVEYFRKFSLEQLQKAEVKIAELEKQVAEAEGVYTAIGLTPKEAQNG